ncbi:MAG: type II toxin-antitoxin system VapC family toxin [Propionibacteriaceae bacterium]|nr:type II toxin-antitoxin system VapC family toxin [Propionibacteriaceae bacterium]
MGRPPPLVGAAWALRDSASAHDAMYVALAERLGCPLLTCDRRPAKAFTHRVMPQG